MPTIRKPQRSGELWRRRENGALIQLVLASPDGFVFDNLTQPELRRTYETWAELQNGAFAADFLADSLAEAFAQGLIVTVDPRGARDHKAALLNLAQAAAMVHNLHGQNPEAPEWAVLRDALAASLPFVQGAPPAAPPSATERAALAARSVAEVLSPAFDALSERGTARKNADGGRGKSLDPERVADVVRTLSALLRSRR